MGGSSAVAGGLIANLNVNTVPTSFRIPATLSVGPSSFATSCTGRFVSATTNKFIGCAPLPAVSIATGATVSGTVNGQVVTATTTVAFGPASGGDLVVNTGAGTAPFAPQVMFVDGILTQCPGYDSVASKFTADP